MAQGLQGLWVSLAYTRAFGTLGLQFKSGQTHHQYECAKYSLTIGNEVNDYSSLE